MEHKVILEITIRVILIQEFVITDNYHLSYNVFITVTLCMRACVGGMYRFMRGSGDVTKEFED